MNPWNQHTLFRLLTGFVTGILLYNSAGKEVIPFYSLWCVFALTIAVKYLVRKYTLYRYQFCAGLLLITSMTGIGYHWSSMRDQSNNSDYVGKIYNRSDALLVQIIQPPEPRPASVRVVVKVLACEQDSVMQEASGKLLLYFAKDSLVNLLRYGDRLMINSLLETPKPPVNPGEFNYQSYLFRKNIFYQSYVKPQQWSLIGRGFGNPIFTLAYSLRRNFSEVFSRHHLAGKEYAVANALVLGIDDYLDADTRKQFSGAGAMHILCVSGLHVGIIVLMLNSVLFFLNRNKSLRLLKALLILCGVWLYAMLTGLSPSVMRAAGMFSFVIIGMLLNRPGGIYNSLTTSAFFLLLFNPFLIFELGFQLSYAAVLAIVSIQPLIKQLWHPESKMAKGVWDLITVSIAAQLGTFPLAMFYFNQFPNYFIISNLFAIPLATVILYTGMAVVILSFIPFVSYWLSVLLSQFLKILNLGVQYIEQLPGAVTDGIYISFAALLLIYFMVYAFFKAWENRKVIYVHAIFTILVLMAGENLIRNSLWGRQIKIIAYSLPNDAAIDLVSGRHAHRLLSHAALIEPSKYSFQMQGSLLSSGIRNVNQVSLDTFWQFTKDEVNYAIIRYHPPLLFWAGQTFLIYDEHFNDVELPEPIQVDHIFIISNSMQVSRNIFQHIAARHVIITNRTHPRARELWKSLCAEASIPYHVISEQGAFSVTL